MHAASPVRFRRIVTVTLLVVTIIGAGLRFVGLGFGQEALNARPDEELIRSAALNSLAGDLNPHYAVWGHLYHYLYVAAGAVYLGCGVWSGRHASWIDAVAAAHCDPTTFEILGRAISAVAGTVTLLITYRLARRTLRSRWAAVGSCIVLSTMFLHVRDSHFCTSDVLLTMNTTGALAAMCGPTERRGGRVGMWTGLGLATKLLAVIVIVTYATVLVLERFRKRRGADARSDVASFAATVGVAACLAVILQPFWLLDPMETCFGLLGDLFNPERHPFESGLHLVNGSIIVHYYVPQSMGWLVGGLAVAGGVHLLCRGQNRAKWVMIVFVFWSLLALLSVERIFMRYVDMLLPIASVFAGHAMAVACRWVARDGRRATLGLVASVAIASPNLARDILLDHRLLQPDTRSLAGDWVRQHVPPGSRILWAGFGHTPSHLTMPRLFTTDEHDQQLMQIRASRGLPTELDDAIRRYKRNHAAPGYSLVAVSIASDQPERPSFEVFPFVDHHYEIAWLEAIDHWSRECGWLVGETPRVDLVHRFLTAAGGLELTNLADRHEPYLVITGMPADPAVIAAVGTWYEEVQVISPGRDAAAMYQGGLYDQGDAWFLPNRDIYRVERGGVEIHIFQRRAN